MKTWVEQFKKNPKFIHSKAAIELLQKEAVSTDLKRKTQIPVLLMNRYFQAPGVDKRRIILLLEEAGKKGHSYLGIASNRQPVFFNIILFRLKNMYPYLGVDPAYLFRLSINTQGYLGKLIKQAARVCDRGEPVDAILDDVNAVYQTRPILERLSTEAKHTSGLSFRKLIDAIHQENVPSYSNALMNIPYQVSGGSGLPNTLRYPLHDAALHYNVPMIRELIGRGANPLARDFWGRNFLHIGEILEIEEIREVAESLPRTILSQLQQQKDGLGRTPAGLRAWKAKRNYLAFHRNQEENGGWDAQILEQYNAEVHEIDMVSCQDISFRTFSENHMSTLKPALIRGGSAQMKQLQRLWQKKDFQQRFPDLPISTGDIPYAGTFGKEVRRLQLKDYQPTREAYVFSGINRAEYPKLFEDFQYLGFFNKLANRHAQFYQGIAGTGAPLHSHIDAWNALVHGKKRWFLFPPLQGYYSTKPIWEWLENGYPQVKPLEFMQEAGDIVYIPRHWSHAVLNLQESVGIAVEFVNPYVI